MCKEAEPRIAEEEAASSRGVRSKKGWSERRSWKKM